MKQLDKQTPFQASVVITTKNRKDDLRKAITSAVMQSPPVEIIVIDDGSSDGTSEMVAAEFPTVMRYRSETSLGLIVQRNNAARLVTTNFVFSLDDDAELSSPHTVAQTIIEFDTSGVGAVSIPFIDTYRNIRYGFNLPADCQSYVDSTYIGTAHALRADVFRKLGGYREYLYHQGEEDDYCLRMMDAGYFVKCGRADHILHHVSAARDLEKIAYFAARNAVLFAWANVPMPYFIAHIFGTTAVNFLSGLRKGLLWATIKGLVRGYMDIISSPAKRIPVSLHAYKLSRKIRKQGIMELRRAEQYLAAGAKDRTRT